MPTAPNLSSRPSPHVRHRPSLVPQQRSAVHRSFCDLSFAQGNGDTETIVCVSGEIDLLTAPGLQSRLAACLSDRHRRVTIDISEVSFMGASGLSVLVKAAKKMRDQGGELIVRHPQRMVRRMVEVTGLESYIRLEPVHGEASNRQAEERQPR